MSLEAEGAYIRLLAYNWQDGFIPRDVRQLAKMCKCSPRKMEKLWEHYLHECFTARDGDDEKLVNPRLEEIRAKLDEFKNERSESGSKGAASRWKNHGSVNGSAIKEPMAKDSSPSPSPSPSPNTLLITNTSNIVASPEKRALPDLASDYFAEQCLAILGSPYVPERGDFVMLAKLRKGFGTAARERPPGWEIAVENYLHSPLRAYSLADLANPKRYGVFKNSTVDQYQTPIHHENRSNGTNGDKQKRNAETARRLLLKLHPQNGGGRHGGFTGTDASDLLGTPAKALSRTNPAGREPHD